METNWDKVPKKCNRCGKCCRIIVNNKLSPLECKYLRHLKNGKTYCAVYDRRLGIKVRKDVKCILRADSPWDYAGCPLNTNKPIIPEWDPDEFWKYIKNHKLVKIK